MLEVILALLLVATVICILILKFGFHAGAGGD